MRHVLLFCNDRSAKDQLLASTGTNDITQMLSASRGLQATTKWLIGQGVLQKFQLAHEIQQGDTKGYAPSPSGNGHPRLTAGGTLVNYQTLLLPPPDLPTYPGSMVRKADL